MLGISSRQVEPCKFISVISIIIFGYFELFFVSTKSSK